MNDSCNIHVLHVVSGDLWAGAEVQLYTLAKTMHIMPDAKVTVVILNPGGLEQRLKQTGIEVFVLDESKLNGFQIIRRLINIIRELKPDVVHTHRIKENVLGSIAVWFSGSIPTMRTAHGAPEHRPAWYHVPKRFFHFLDRFSGRYLQQKIIAVSEDLAGILEKDYPKTKIQIIKNGIDVKNLTQSSHATKTEGSTSDFCIGIAGRLVPVKRVDLFLRVAQELVNTHPELKFSFRIFGDGPLRNDLESFNEQLGLQEQVRFEGHCENIHDRLRSLDVLLMTSDHEGLPIILLEAMALQTPIVAHAVGGIPNLLDYGNSGVLVEVHTPESYAAAVVKLLKEPVYRTGIINNALSRVKVLYSAEQNAKAYCVTYMQISKQA